MGGVHYHEYCILGHKTLAPVTPRDGFTTASPSNDLLCCNILCGWQHNLLLSLHRTQFVFVEVGNSREGGVVGVDSGLGDGGVLQGLPRLDLLLQAIVNLVISHLCSWNVSEECG